MLVELTERGIELRSAAAEVLAGLDEKVLAALGLLLNGGGLAHLKTINAELGISREDLLAGEPFASFAARWSAFARPTDLLTTWGHYASEVATHNGLVLPERIDLHRATALFLGEKTGVVEAMPQRLGIRAGVPWARGRAGLRLGAMAAVHAALAAHARTLPRV